jgi:L-rhamnose mutarotase
MSLNRDSKSDSKSIPKSRVIDSKRQIPVAKPSTMIITKKLPSTVQRFNALSSSKRPMSISQTSWFFKRKLGHDIEDRIVQFLTKPINPKNVRTAIAFIKAARPTPLSRLFEGAVKKEWNRRVTELCQYVVYGKYDEVKAILEKNPQLLLYRARVKDYSFYQDEKGKRTYREMEGTAYQLALAAEDISREQWPDEGMADMMLAYFERACGDNEKATAEIRKQQRQQFPAGYEKLESDKKSKDSIALKEVVDAIKNAKVEFINGSDSESNGEVSVDAKGEAALNKFRQYLMPTGVITSGKLFNIDLLIEAFELYEQKFEEFGGSPHSPRNVLFWRKIIGYIERHLPTSHIQVLCHLLYDDKPLIRELVFGLMGPVFLPLDSDPHLRLGYDYAIGWHEQGQMGLLDEVQRRRQYLSEFMRGKHTSVAQLRKHPDNEEWHSCLVM